MKIPDELLKRWNDLRSYGDGRRITEANPDTINEMDISRAFTKGECPDNIFEILASFYKEKDEKVKAYL